MEHHDAQTPSDTPRAIAVGARLKATREAQGLGLGEVADRLKLSLRQLEAIESDHFSALPGATFVRGFVRNYARFLEIDPEPLMHDLEAQFPSSVHDVANLTKGEAPHPTVEEKPVVSEPQTVGPNHKGAWLGFALVGVVVAGLAWWMVDGRNHHDDAAPEPEGHLAPMLTESSAAAAKPASAAAAAKPASAPAVVAKPASAPVAAAPVKAVVASAPAAAVVVAPVKPAVVEKAKTASAPAAAKEAGAGSVRLVTKGDSWVSVTDADGNKLVYQLLADGTEKTVSGKAPIKVILGHASNVQMYFNGQQVDFTSKIKGETAKIELK